MIKLRALETVMEDYSDSLLVYETFQDLNIKLLHSISFSKLHLEITQVCSLIESVAKLYIDTLVLHKGTPVLIKFISFWQSCKRSSIAVLTFVLLTILSLLQIY